MLDTDVPITTRAPHPIVDSIHQMQSTSRPDFFDREGGQPRTMEQYVALIRSHMALRHSGPPTIQQNTTLHSSDRRPVKSFPWSARNSVQYHDFRPVPPLAQHVEFGTRQCSLVLTVPLYEGEDQWSQVWIANMSLVGLPHLGVAPVVVKIFQESRYEWTKDEPGPFRLYINFDEERFANRLAKREALAYDLLHRLQGRVIPWSYGHFKFNLPNGESAFAHVMEYIQGPSLLNAPLPSGPMFDHMLDCITWSLQDIHAHGIIHNDIRLPNMIVQPGRQCIVFVDFTESIKPYTIERKVNELTSLFGTLRRNKRVGIARMKLWADQCIRRNSPWKQLVLEVDTLKPGWWAVAIDGDPSYV
ncbi:hypothetical protein B0H21DRAFT_891692 [Amylocystis lapponica]|nr:hypothetical protein B0H21DRAFT_891692 [Amylocystis lapponica]